MSTLKDCFETIIKSLCDFPEALGFEWLESNSAIHIDLKPSKDDVRRLIGKNGVTANALRTLLHASHARDKKKTYMSIRS